MESQRLAVIVLAAGLGKRMASQQPKVLHRLAGLPLAAHVLRAVAPLEPSRTVFVVGHQGEQVRAALGSSYGSDSKFPLEYVEQAEQLGTGHAVLMAENALSDHRGPVLVVYGDTPLLRTTTLSAMLNRHRQGRARLTMLTCIAADPTGYGRIIRDQGGTLLGVVEEREATLVQRAISEINSGVYIFESDWLWPHLTRIERRSSGEYYLTDLIGMAIKEDQGGGAEPYRRGASGSSTGVITFTLDGIDEAMGINSRVQLSEAEAVIQKRLRQKWMEEGVTILLPETVYLSVDATIGPDTVLYPGVILEGATTVGSGCTLGPNTHIIDSSVGDNCRIVASMIEESVLERGVTVGPYSHVRPGSRLGEDVHMGNFGEVKNTTLERGVAMGHFSYIGDAHIGAGTNIGAGTITANYDGTKKNPTTVGENVFLGVDTMLVAPIEVGDGARTGAGSVVTKNVQPNTLVVGVPARMIKRLEPQASKEAGESSGSQGTNEE